EGGAVPTSRLGPGRSLRRPGSRPAPPASLLHAFSTLPRRPGDEFRQPVGRRSAAPPCSARNRCLPRTALASMPPLLSSITVGHRLAVTPVPNPPYLISEGAEHGRIMIEAGILLVLDGRTPVLHALIGVSDGEGGDGRVLNALRQENRPAGAP